MMIRPGSRLLDRCRKAGISVFVLFHFWALIVWMIPPYSGMISDSPYPGSLAGRLERSLFYTLVPQDGGAASMLARHYIDLSGAYQYWDFFAPVPPRIHRYLQVCTKLLESPDKGRIGCIEPWYRSFDGDVDHAVRPHRGSRSRSFRLVENLIRLHRPDLLNAFTLYWRHKKPRDDKGQSFLLLHEFSLQPGRSESESATGRRDELIWIAPE